MATSRAESSADRDTTQQPSHFLGGRADNLLAEESGGSAFRRSRKSNDMLKVLREPGSA